MQRCPCEKAGPEGQSHKDERPIRQNAAGGPESALAPPIVHEVLRAPGRPLEQATRTFMESRLGHDFGQVRVHTDADASESARAVQALAYTVGHEVVFRAGQYQPDSVEGKKILAHELTHVAQDREVGSPPAGPLRVSDAADRGEKEAKAAEMRMTTHENGGVATTFKSTSTPLLRRQPAAEREQPSAAPEKVWYMLKVPPPIKQDSLTCWAAALSSWLQAMGADKQSFQQIIMRYVGTACIDTENALYYATATEVFGEWGAEFVKHSKPGAINYANLKAMLQKYGHLLLAQTGTSLGHAMVVYGVGIDDKQMPNPDFMSVMDPMSGTHENRRIDSLSYPVEIGHLTKRIRPASCLSRPGEVPKE